MTHPASPFGDPTPPRSTAGELLIGAQEAARRLSVCARSLWEWSNSGLIPSVKLGRRRLYDPADLRAFVEKAKKSGH